jgi:Matrixin/IPT/TIG domain
MNINSRIISMFAVLILMISISVPNVAAMVLQKNLTDLTKDADSIVVGNVTDKNSYMKNGKIYTNVTVSVDIRIKGQSNSKVVVEVPGGAVGDKYAEVSDAPFFEKGQNVLLFSNGKDVVGMDQGKFTIKNEKIIETGESLAEFVHKIKKEGKIINEKGKTGKDIDVVSFKLDNATRMTVPDNDSKNKIPGKSGDNILTPIKYEGFEGNFPEDNGWVLYGDPTWNDTSYTAAAGLWSGWNADGGLLRVNPGTSYPNNMDAWMVYGPFSLAGATDAFVTFNHLTKTQTYNDTFQYMASIDGSNFWGTQLSGDWTPWKDVTFDLKNVYTLGDLRGHSQVWIAFRFTSDGSISDLGTFLDEINIQKDSVVSALPHITGVTPDFGHVKATQLGSSVAASDSTQVTITGTGFGSAAGSAKFWRVGTTTYDATIVSWTDTQIVAKVPGRISSYTKPDGYGNVQVVKGDGSPSDNYGNFRVTYSYGGGKWPGTGLTYKVNPNTADTTDESAAVQAAANSWNAAGANFTLTYGGLSTVTGLVEDGENSIIWATGFPPGVIGMAWTIWGADPHVILENDIEFNDDFTWGTDGSSTKMDIQTIAVHELGHWLQLLDVYGSTDSGKIMYGYGSVGGIKRTLATDDTDGIRGIYGVAQTSQPATVFVRGHNMDVWYNKQSGSTWSGWQSLGGYVISNISSVTLGSDTYIFVNGSDRGVWYNKRTGTSWGGWQSLGGIATSNPEAAVLGSDVYVFVRSSDNALWYRKLTGTIWTSWSSLGGVVTSNPDAKLLGTDLYVFVRSSDNALWHRKLSGTTWTSWASLGGIVTSDPDAASNDVFIRGSDMGVWYNRLSGNAFAGWTSLGGIAASNPDAIQGNVFVRGSDHTIWHNKWGGSSWSGWQSLGGYATSDPEAVVSGSDTYVFVRSSDNALWYRMLTGTTWTPWSSLGGVVTSNPSAVPN